MNNPIKRLTLDVNKEQNYETLTVKQGDINSRTYKITLTSNGQAVMLTSSDSVMAKAERDGKTVALINCEKTGNEITLTLSPAMLAVAGDLRVEIMVYSGNSKLTSATQIFKVDRAISESPIVNTPDFSALNNMVKRVEAVVASPTVDGELKDARGGETALRYRLEKIESGERILQGSITNDHLAYNAVDTMEIADGAITLDKMAAEAKEAFAEKNHTHANYAEATHAGAQQFLSRGVMIYSDSLVGAVNAAAIQKNAVTETKLSSDVLEKYGHLPYTHISSDTIAFDNYISNGIYHFEGRYAPVTLFVLVGDDRNITQIRIQGDKIQSRAYKSDAWTDWSGDKTELAENLNQLDAQVAQLQIDTQAHGAKLDTLDRQYAGTAVIFTTSSYKMDASQVVPGSKVILTLTNGPTTSCFVRADHHPLYYYGTEEVVKPEYNTPIPVSAEDLIAGVKLSYDGAFKIEYQTGPSKVFLDRIAALEARIARLEISMGGGETA